MNNTNVYMLSILIPSIPERDIFSGDLWEELWRQRKELGQHPMLGLVEFLVDDSKAFLDGGLSIGKKREGLVNASSGKYLCFLDDDESIAPNYLETLVRLCNEDKDVCTFRNITKLDNFWTVVDMSISHAENEQVTPDAIVKRRPWQICPMRSEYAKLYSFENINYGEDWKWMEQVLTHCKTEAHTNMVIQQYNHSSKLSEADKIVRHEKG